MMGKEKGEQFTFDSPNGKVKYKVVDIS